MLKNFQRIVDNTPPEVVEKTSEDMDFLDLINRPPHDIANELWEKHSHDELRPDEQSFFIGACEAIAYIKSKY